MELVRTRKTLLGDRTVRGRMPSEAESALYRGSEPGEPIGGSHSLRLVNRNNE